VTVFGSIENGIYTSICASFALLIIRVAHPRGHFMGKVTLQSDPQESKGSREVFVPLNPSGVVNPQVKVDTPLPGIVIYRFEESFLYPNSSLVDSALVDYVKAHTRRGQDMTHVKYSDRPWNDPGPGRFGAAAVQAENERKPILHAIVLDFSGVSHIDTTGVQSLIDTRGAVERWADRPIEFHFATVLSPWIRRALIAGGFGVGTSAITSPREIAPLVSYYGDSRDTSNFPTAVPKPDDTESHGIKHDHDSQESHSLGAANKAPLAPVDTPFIHFDLIQAVNAAEHSLQQLSSRQDFKQ